jgi:hypothetical protein
VKIFGRPLFGTKAQAESAASNVGAISIDEDAAAKIAELGLADVALSYQNGAAGTEPEFQGSSYFDDSQHEHQGEHHDEQAALDNFDIANHAGESTEQTSRASDIKDETVEDGSRSNERPRRRETSKSSGFFFIRRRSASKPRHGNDAHRGKSLPLGVDVAGEGINILAARIIDGEFVVTEAHHQAFPGLLNPEHRAEAVEAIAEVLGRFESKERRCIIALDGGDSRSLALQKLPTRRKNELNGYAMTHANRFKEFDDDDRAFSIDALDDDHILLTIARKKTVAGRANMVRAAGLKPIAVDTSWLVWQRAIPEVHAVLDLRTNDPSLNLFAREVNGLIIPGESVRFQENITDVAMSSKIGNLFMEKRRDSGFDVKRIAIAATYERYCEAAKILEDSVSGLTVTPVTIGQRRLPDWAFAFGLARWSLPDLGAIA